MKRKEPKFEPLAIVGMSCLFPKAQSLEDYWANIKEKVDAITEVPPTHWKAEDYLDSDKKRADHVYTSTGGFLDPVDFVPGEWGIAPSDLDAIDTSQLLSLVVAQGALNDAGYGASRDFNRDNVSVILGLTGTLEMVVPLGARLGHPIWRRAMQHAGIPSDITEEVIKNIGKAYVGWQENSFPGLLGNVAAGRIANRLNLGGTNCVVDAACGSSLSAINHAALELWTGKTDMAITGGVDTFNDIFMYMCFCKTPALSATGQARPFSADNDGTILGEGIGMLVIKRLSDAERDGDRIYACINAVGSSSDGKGKAIYAPSPEGQKKALIRAYEMAAITPRDVSLIEAHGTGTNAGDEVEVSALKDIYGTAENGRPWCALGSVKSQIGHTKAAAGSAGMIKAALALYHKVIPPTIKISQPAPGVSGESVPFYMPDRIRPWITDDARPRIAAVSALGFGGSNFHVVVSEYKSDKVGDDWQRGVELITISGKTADDIEKRLVNLPSCKNAHQLRKFAAESRRDFNVDDNCRLTFIIESNHDIEKIVTDITGNLAKKSGSFNLPNGAYFATGSQKAPVGVIFPGQGAQYPGMSLDLVCSNKEAFATFIEADHSIASLDAQNNHLVDYVFPRTTYNAEKDKLNDEKLRATDIAQPAIGAIALGQYRALAAFGLQVDGFAGHSYGELVSLCAAGAFDNATLAKLSRRRGQLMAQGSGDRGGMIAVAADRTHVKELITKENLDLVVANHNSPQQVVLSGKTSEIERSREIFKQHKLRATVLNVAGAFHSKFVADAAEPFHAFLATEKINKPNIPVYANTTAAPYPAEAAEIKKLLGFQLANQVRFVEIIEKMYADGIRTFIEAGPGGKITSLIKSILEGRECNIIAVDSSAGKRSGLNDLGRVIAQLSAIGYKLQITRWQNGENWLAQQPPAGKPKLSFPVCGANYKSAAQVKFCEELAKPAPVKLTTEKAATAQPTPTLQPSAPRASVTTPTPAQYQQPAPYAASAPAMPAASNDALRLSRETLSALQQLQQQTAELHRRFLEGQETAQKTIMALVSGQQMPATAGLSYAQPTAPAYVQPPVYTMQPAPQPAQPPQPVARPAAPAQAPAAKAVPAAKPAQLAPAAPDTSRIQPVLLEVVSEKTGYPVEMLNLDMDMEADLGIDSIKRVEIMSAMQERLPDAPVVQPDQLGKLRTLTQILQYLGSSAGKPVTSVQTQSATPAAADTSRIQPVLLEVVSEKTGYPVEMLNLDMDMEADLGIDSIKRVEIMSAMQERLPEAPVVQPDQLGKLRTLTQILQYLGSNASTAASGPASVQTANQAGASANIMPVLIEIVSEKTGYPAEMLNLDMDMEADLGIDSIKRVEIMSAMQERLPDAPVVQPDQLGKLRTLAQILEHLGSSSNASAQPAASHAAPATTTHGINGILLEVIADKTGYPTDMLNPDMDMEADLGIDSIKRVEILSAFQERVPEAPVVQPGDLGKFRTIAQILEYLNAGNAASAAPVATKAADATKPAVSIKIEPFALDKSAPEHFPLKRTVLRAYELGLSQSEPLKTLKKGDSLIVVDDGYGLAEAVCEQFASAGYKPCRVKLSDVGNAKFLSDIKGFILIAPLPEKAAHNLWDKTSEEWLKDCFIATQKAGMAIRANGNGLIATVSRLDGAFGLESPTRTIDPVQGGLAGLSKTITHEWPEMSVRAIDLDYRFKDAQGAAEKLVRELLQQGPVETGLTRSTRYGLREVEEQIDELPDSEILQQGETIVVTGGARGVTAETALEMAQKYHTNMVLIGRSPEPTPEPAWLNGVIAEPAVKQAILANSGRKLTPKELEAEFKATMANREVLTNLSRIRNAGVKAFYYSADIRDADDTARAIERARKETGPIRGLMHGAGVLRDRRIEDKTRDQLDDVIDTKVAGLRNLLLATLKDDIRAIILFSSFSGRFGRTGQVDYSMANEVLNKAAHKLRIIRPECRVLSFNWGPWDGGMVTPALRNVFLAEGIGLIPLRDGARQPIVELSQHSTDAVEIGIIGEVVAAPQPEKKFDRVFDFELNLNENTCLKDHVINGDAVLPMAVAAELLAHAATLRNPGLQFAGYDELRVLKGLVLKNETLPVTLYAARPRKCEEGFKVTCEIRSAIGEREITNIRADVLLTERLPAKVPAAVRADAHLVYPDSINEVYQNHLFHGEFLKALQIVEGWSENGIIANSLTALDPTAWFARPPMLRWHTDPMVVDAAYQLMILWTTQACGAPSLPSFARHYRQYTSSFGSAPVTISARTRRSGAMMASADIDFIDASGKLLARIEGYECTINENLRNAFKLRSVGGAEK